MSNTPEATSPKPCPECGGERVQAQCGMYMGVRNSTARTLTMLGLSSGLDALVCTNCGYTTFYAQKPSIFKK